MSPIDCDFVWKNTIQRLQWLVLAFLISACAAWQPAPTQLQTAGYTLVLPEGWMRFSTPAYEMVSKDGPYLQYILVESRSLERAFRFTRRKMRSDLLPHEAALIIVDNLRCDPQIKGFKLLANEPSLVGGKMGFRLVYSYVDRQGIDIQSIYYGVVLPDRFFNLRYAAAKRYYFDKDFATFKQVYQSVQLAASL